MRPWAALLACVVVALSVGVARAQPSLSAELGVEATRVEVGAPFAVTLSASSSADDATPTNPELHAPPGVSVRGPNIGSQQQMSISGGQVTVRRGLRATWSVTASRTGRLSLGPGTVAFGGKRVRTNVVTVEVVPAGQGGHIGRSRPDPFGLLSPPGFPDPFTMPDFPGLQLDFDDLDPDRLPPYPPELATDEARDPLAFLNAVVTPRRVVVGEQVTLRVVAYGKEGRFREGKSTEPTTASFISYPIVETSYGEQPYLVDIRGTVWRAIKLRELALFPVDTGTLRIGAMEMEFLTLGGRPYAGRQVERSSQAIDLVVTEPPVAGRPRGYRLGDVGRYTLESTVQPREVTSGQAISVVMKVEGTGNLPNRLRMPQQTGVEWLEPTVTEEIEIDQGKLRGKKRLSYVVRLQRPGRVELGAVELPYWDPVRRAYATARADLGVVTVTAAASSVEPQAGVEDRLARLVTPRRALGARVPPPLRWGERPWFWVLLAAGPLGVVGAFGAVRAGARAQERWRAHREAHGTLAEQALADATRAARAGDPAAAASAGERAMFLALEGATGLKARGVLRAELGERLTQVGLAPDVAAEVLALLERCDAVRFTGSAEVAAAELVAQLRACVRRVSRGTRRRPAA